MNRSTIAIIGSNGRAGSDILSCSLAHGFKVKALFRDPSKRPEDHSGLLTVIPGDATDVTVLRNLISGCDIIINAISNKGNPRPVSGAVTSSILEIIKEKPEARYFLITGKTLKCQGDGFSLSTMFQRLMLETAFPRIMRSKREEMRILRGSPARWTAIRCPMIVDGEGGEYRTSLSRCDGKEIDRKNIARFTIDEIEKEEYVRKAPFLYQ